MKKEVEKMVVVVNSGFTVLALSFLFCTLSIETLAQTCTPAPVGLVSWWSGDGNALDSRSRNNSNQTLGAPLFVAAKVGLGMKFDGIDDGFTVPDSANLDVGVGDSFAVSLWVRADSLSGNNAQFQSIFAKEEIAGGGGGFYRLTLRQDGVFDFEIVDTSSNVRQVFSPGIATGSFNHLVAVFNRSAGNMLIYLDGVPQAPVGIGGVGSLANSGRFFIGHKSLDSGTGAFSFNGAVDELSYYNRALSDAEIVAIFNAGTAGKCKPTATAAPSGLVGWWAGDGNPNDISGSGNNGALQAGTTFAVGEVSQSFSFNAAANPGVVVPSNSVLDPAGGLTLEAWVRPSTFPNLGPAIIRRDTDGGGTTQYSLNAGDGVTTGILHCNIGGLSGVTGGSVPLNVWTHVACTYDLQMIRGYVNGIEVASVPATFAIPVSTRNLAIGEEDGFSDRNFDGLIDEASIYNRGLTPEEITSVFNAGIAGKLKTVTTPTGFAAMRLTNSDFRSQKVDPRFAIQTPQSVSTTIGDANVTFPAVTTAGTTQEIPLATSVLPVLPVGFTSTGLYYDVATSAVFTGNATVCFNAPFMAPSQFSRLHVLHLEAGIWQDRTVSGNTFPTVCTVGLSSLSPFALVLSAPTAANVSISGRVLTADGIGISKARLALSDLNGNVRTAITNPFGYYRFEDVLAGETYILSVQSKRYQFANNPQVISVSGELTDVDFTALH